MLQNVLLRPADHEYSRDSTMEYVHTIPSILDKNILRLETTYFATDLTSNGSNFAESNSFATVRAILMPSVIPGGDLFPPLKA